MPKQKQPTFNRLANILDQESYTWLQNVHPDLADAIEAEVARGATPAELRRFVLAYTWRPDIARRIEQAARHLKGGE